MNKNLIISLLVLVIILLGAFMFTKNSNISDQQAATLKTQTQSQKPNYNPAMMALACTVSVTSNPPVLPSTSIPNAPFSAQQVVSVVNVTSSGCLPGDAFLRNVNLIVIPSNVGAIRMDNFTMTDLSTGNVTPAVSYSYGPVTTIGLKPGSDISMNSTITFEVRADFNLDMNVLVPGVSNIITILDNFNISNISNVNPITPITSGMTSQQMFY